MRNMYAIHGVFFEFLFERNTARIIPLKLFLS